MNARIAIVFLTLSALAAPVHAQCGCAMGPCEATTLETVTLPGAVPVPPRVTTVDFAPAVVTLLAIPAMLLTVRARLRLHPCVAS